MSNVRTLATSTSTSHATLQRPMLNGSLNTRSVVSEDFAVLKQVSNSHSVLQKEMRRLWPYIWHADRPSCLSSSTAPSWSSATNWTCCSTNSKTATSSSTAWSSRTRSSWWVGRRIDEPFWRLTKKWRFSRVSANEWRFTRTHHTHFNRNELFFRRNSVEERRHSLADVQVARGRVGDCAAIDSVESYSRSTGKSERAAERTADSSRRAPRESPIVLQKLHAQVLCNFNTAIVHYVVCL